MAIYNKGKASMDAQGYITGYDTKWRESLSLIRPGATLIFNTSPITFAVVAEVISDTSIRAIQTGKVEVAKSDYAILLHDSLTVDGLAQDVAETLRYYQGKETQFERFIEIVKNMDPDEMGKWLDGVKKEADRAAAEAGKAHQSSLTAQAASTVSSEQADRAKRQVELAAAEVQKAKDQVGLAAAEVTKAAGEVEKAKAQVTLANNASDFAQAQADNAADAAGRSTVEADRAAAAAKKAEDLANQFDASKTLLKDNNLSDLADKATARRNLGVDNIESNDTETKVMTKGKDAWLSLRQSDRKWGFWDQAMSAWHALGVEQGGTGAKDAAGARKNIGVDRVVQDNATRLKSQDGKTELRIGNDDWYVYRDSQDSEAGYIPLGVEGGGTGGGTVQEAKENLQLDRFAQFSTGETNMKSGDGTKQVFIKNNGSWGAWDSANNRAALLSVEHGGTGAGNPLDVRRNIEAFHEKKAALTASDNLNTIYGAGRTGYYFNPMNANATAANNYPVQIAGVLLVTSAQANGSQQTFQYYYPFDKHNEYYSRSYNKSGDAWVWSGWNKHVNAYNYGVGKIAHLANDLNDASCQFISDAEGNTNWAPANGAGFQSSYASNRIFQLWITPSQRAYIRYVDSASPRATVAAKAWSELATLNSSPQFTGSTLSVLNGSKKLNIGVGSTDVFFNNATSGKYLQLKDDGSLQYDSKHVMHNDLVQGGLEYNVTLKTFRVIANGNNIQMRSTTDSNPQVFISGHSANNTRLFWMGCGSSDGAVTLNSDKGGNRVKMLTDGSVNVETPGNGKPLNLYGNALVVRRAKNMSYGNEGTSSQDGNFRLWGNSSRPDVLEFALSSGWVFYAQRNTDNSRIFQVNGNVACNQVIQGSDRDLKDNVKVISGATEAIRKMSGYTYTMKENGMPYAGVIAQEVMEALPEAISGISKSAELPGPTKDGEPLQGEDRFLGVDYSAVTGLLVQVCRESDDRITKLEHENESLKSELESMKAAIAQMQTMFTQLAK